jgi:DNA-binding NarL/FixJ family response regulator
MLRQGLARVISQREGLEVVEEASTGAEALSLVVSLKPDLVVLDLHLPDMTGIEAATQILQARPATRIVMFSSDPTRSRIDEALEAGASGYVLKTDAVDELADAISAVMAGKIYLSQAVSAGIVEDYARGLRGEPVPVPPVLSAQERQLLNLVAGGRRNKEIADELDLSVKSVEAQRSRLMKKVGCASSAELVRYAIREGIVAA